jgi:hypothetical protein
MKNVRHGSSPFRGQRWIRFEALAKGKHIVPVIGARTRVQLAEALAGVAVSLSPDDVVSLEAAVPASAVAGTRYDPHQMLALDSER